MRKALALMVLACFLTGCFGDVYKCGGGLVANYIGFHSAWVESDLSPVIESSSGGPILTDTELNLAQPQVAGAVALAVAGELAWSFSSLQPESEENFWSNMHFSLVPRAQACSPAQPSVYNAISAINVSIASITDSNLAPGADVSALFSVVASNKRQGAPVPLLDWNVLTQFEFFTMDTSVTRNNAVYLRFDDPNQFSGTTVTFNLHFLLREGETFDVTTDEITFSN